MHKKTKSFRCITFIAIACSASIAYAADISRADKAEMAAKVIELAQAEMQLDTARLELAEIMQEVSDRVEQSLQAYRQMEDAAGATKSDQSSSYADTASGLKGLTVPEEFALRRQALTEKRKFDDYVAHEGPKIRERIAELEEEIADLDLQVVFLRAIVAQRTPPKKTQSGPL